MEGNQSIGHDWIQDSQDERLWRCGKCHAIINSGSKPRRDVRSVVQIPNMTFYSCEEIQIFVVQSI
jgi:hypothetical protein